VQVTWDALENGQLGMYDVKDQLKQHVYTRSAAAFAAGDLARDNIRSPEEAEERRQAARQAFIEGIGGLPQSAEALNPVITSTLRLVDMRIEQIIFESRPNTHVTCSMYIPDGLTAPAAAILFVCGHYDEGRMHPNYQKVCRTIAAAGLIVLAMDPIGQGERSSFFDPVTGEQPIPHSVAEHEQAGAQCWPLGDGLARYFVHDIVRAVDYLCTRPEVDPQRIGITGNSGGGTQTSMAMLVEPRLAAAAPGTFIMSRETYMYAGQAQDAEQIWPVMTAKGFDHEDILLAMAPKPVIVLAAQYDFFPIEGTRRTVERARRIWELLGQVDRLQLFEDRCEHCYSDKMAVAAAVFFAKHLSSGESNNSLVEQLTDYNLSIKPIDQQLLHCTQDGQIREQFAGERGPCEENETRLHELELLRGQYSAVERQERALSWLKEKVLDSSGRKPVDFNPRLIPMGAIDGMKVDSWLWWSQEGLFNHAYVFKEENSAETGMPVVIAVWERGTRQLASRMEWIRKTVASGKAVMVLDVSGEGAVMPNAISPADQYERFGTIHKLTTDLFFIGDSMAAIRTFDVLRAVMMALLPGHIGASSVELYSEGKSGLYVVLAGFVDQKQQIASWGCKGGFSSMADWVQDRLYDGYDVLGYVLPGMLHYFDLPDLVEM